MKNIIIKLSITVLLILLLFLIVRFLYLRWYLKAIKNSEIKGPAILSGAFIQPTSPVNQFNEDQMAKELHDMHNIGLNYVILQWSADSSSMKSIYPSKIYNKDETFVQGDLIENILMICDKTGMKVYLGLDTDSSWEKNINSKDKTLRMKEINLSIKTAEELYSKYKRHKSFYGWYLPNEISDFTILTNSKRTNLHGYLSDISSKLKKIDNTKKIAIAPYFSKFIYPPKYEMIWKYLLKDSHIDVLMLQDGVGCKRIKLNDIASYFGSMKRATDYAHVKLISDVEVFEQVHGWPVDNQSWEAKPGNINMIKKQLILESNFVSAQVCFDFSHYMSLQNSKQTADLYIDYQNYINK